MDQGFAVKAHVAALLAFGLEPFIVFIGIIDTVDQRDAMGFARQHAQAQTRHHRQAVCAETGLQILGQIVGAHDHALQFGVCGDGGGVQHAQRCLHHRPERDVAGDVGQCIQIGGAVDLGQQDGVCAHIARRAGIIGAPFGVQTVDADDFHAGAVSACLECFGQCGAGGHLFLGDHGVFEIKDDRVGGQAAGLVQRAGLGAGDVENGTQGAGDGGHEESSF